jgi:ribose transport system permease protein
MIPNRSRLTLTALAPYLALLAMVLVASMTSEHFLQIRNILNITRQVSYTGIIALGMTFVIIAGGIDLSVGSEVAFVGGIIILALNDCFAELAPGSQWLAFFFALACGLGVGLVGGVLSGWLSTVFNIAPFITTLGFMGMYRSLALYTGDGGEFRVTGGISSFSGFGTGMVWGVPVPSLIFILLAVFFGVILNWTRFGRYVCAVGSNEKVAAYAAIKVGRVRTLTYVICGLTVALAAFLLGGRMNSINSTNAGTLYELDAIAAVVIGGTAMTGGSGSMAGTVIGALMLGIINNMLNMWGVSAYLQGTVKGLVIVLAVLVQRPEVQVMAKDAWRALFGGKK